MNALPEYHDRRGRPLAVGCRVRAVREEYEVRGEGTVEALPKAGNDHYEEPSVRFDHDGKRRHVAASLLERTDAEDPRVAALEHALAAQKAYIAAMRRLSEQLERDR